MAGGTKIIQHRIRSISNTKKITKAMKMVSAAKMRKATGNVLATRPYSNLAWDIIGNLSRIKEDWTHPLLTFREKKTGKSLVILITSDKGLCGGFNAQMFRETKHFISRFNPPSVVGGRRGGGYSLDFIVLGKKGESFAHREKLGVVATFENLTNNPKFVNIKPIAKMAMDGFVNGVYDEVFTAYTDYISTLVQKPRVRQLLPVIKDKDLGEIGAKLTADSLQPAAEYLFEPEKSELLEMMLPKIVETQIYQAILESVASEQSARMVAMQNATDAANEMVEDLKFTYNKIRQAGITREISEISAGKAAIE